MKKLLIAAAVLAGGVAVGLAIRYAIRGVDAVFITDQTDSDTTPKPAVG